MQAVKQNPEAEVKVNKLTLNSSLKVSEYINEYKKSMIVEFAKSPRNTTLDLEDRETFKQLKIEPLECSEIKSKEYFDKWVLLIGTLKANFSSSDECHSNLREILNKDYREEWQAVVEKFDNAVENYFCAKREFAHIKAISDESARSFLYLIPIFSKYKPCVSIDADTGYFTATFTLNNNGMMTVLVAERGHLHYSLAERGVRLVKISGTAKIKDPHDLTKFHKVLSML